MGLQPSRQLPVRAKSFGVPPIFTARLQVARLTTPLNCDGLLQSVISQLECISLYSSSCPLAQMFMIPS